MILIFIFLTAIVFGFYHNLLNSYFEADEWFHFTRYLPLTKEINGPLIAIQRSITDAIALSEGQHVVPIGEEIFFLNTKFFGNNFVPYAFMSLALHSLNSFLVFILTGLFLKWSKLKSKNLVSITSAVFFAVSAIPMHAVTWAAFYGQNVLSVTFFLLTLIFFKNAFETKNKKYLILSSVFLFLSLLTKETSAVLLLILPFIVLQERGIFSVRTFVKFFAIPLIIFIPFRFILPVLYSWMDVNLKMTSTNILYEPTSFDLSIVLYRIFTFPISMISQVFIPNISLLNFLRIITPYIYYKYPGEPAIRSTYREFFINGPGINFLYYIISFGIVALIFIIVKNYWRSKKIVEAKAVTFGFIIITLSALPLVLNVLNRPWWGTEYFDSRHYYMPTVGAGIIFSFFILFFSENMSKVVKKMLRLNIPAGIIGGVLFVLWFINNAAIFNSSMDVIVRQTGYPRKKIIEQLRTYLPKLPEKAVLYFETDGGGPYGTILPFQTSVPQVITVAYYGQDPLPNSFFNTFIFGGKPHGYFESEGRALGVYNSKKTLSEDLAKDKFSIEDIYGFHYEFKNTKVKNITSGVRQEMQDFRNQTNIHEKK